MYWQDRDDRETETEESKDSIENSPISQPVLTDNDKVMPKTKKQKKRRKKTKNKKFSSVRRKLISP